MRLTGKEVSFQGTGNIGRNALHSPRLQRGQESSADLVGESFFSGGGGGLNEEEEACLVQRGGFICWWLISGTEVLVASWMEPCKAMPLTNTCLGLPGDPRHQSQRQEITWLPGKAVYNTINSLGTFYLSN